MGWTTDFVGHVDISPPLNPAEVTYLTAFSRSRRFDRVGGPYEVPGNPLAERHEDLPRERSGDLAAGQPGFHCDWTPCWDGCCLSYNGVEKFYAAEEWLRYLIEHFLKPRALASRTRDEQFAEFTFDHYLSGVVVGCQRHDRELYSLTVTNNRVRKKILRPGDLRFDDYPPLPYEVVIDEQEAASTRRRRRAG